MKKALIFGTTDINIVCMLAYFQKKGYELKPTPIKNIECLWEQPDVWLLNIPTTTKNDLDFFAKMHPRQCLSLSDFDNFETDKSGIYSLNNSRENLLQLWQKEKRLLTLSKDIANPLSWPRSPQARRYGEALKVSQIIYKHYLPGIMMYVALEINSGRENNELNDLQRYYKQMVINTNELISKVEIKESPFSIPNRPVAYGYFDHLPRFIDMKEVKTKLLKKFPYLVVIQYRQGKKEEEEKITWIASKKINVRQILMSPPGPPQEIIFQEEFEEVNKNFREKISEIT